MKRPPLYSILQCFFLTGLVSSAYAGEAAPVLDPDAGQPVKQTVHLPRNDLFKPLLADLKEPGFYLSYRRYTYQSDRINSAVGGYGEIIGLYRSQNKEKGTAWQANFGGGIHSQFNLDARSFALVNTDYTIGFPFTFRKGQDSVRLALYHQSSHLGDEFLLQTEADRIEFSYEAINCIASREWAEWRAYAGGEYLVHRVPSNLKPLGLQAGIEYYSSSPARGTGRLVGGFDLKSDQEHNWTLNASVKVGLQYDSSEPRGHYIQVLLEGYKGYAPHGQFYTERLGFFGLSIALGSD